MLFCYNRKWHRDILIGITCRLDQWSPGAGFIPIATINLLSLKRIRDLDFKKDFVIMKREQENPFIYALCRYLSIRLWQKSNSLLTFTTKLKVEVILQQGKVLHKEYSKIDRQVNTKYSVFSKLRHKVKTLFNQKISFSKVKFIILYKIFFFL